MARNVKPGLAVNSPLFGEENPSSSGQNEKTILDHIERTANRVPERGAISYNGRTIRYLDLMRNVDHLAIRILEATGGKRGFVAVYGERSPEVIVSLLAVLRAGCAYVPLDRHYPRERREFVLEDSGAELILADTSVSDDMGKPNIPAITVDLSVDAPAVSPPTNLPSPAGSETAYAIYTSGSTGRPKGVLISHGNLKYSNEARIRYYPEPPERFLLLSSHAFDSSFVGIFWTLATGGELVLPLEGEGRDPRTVVETIERQRITHTLCLPSLYSAILDRTNGREIGSLRTVIVAGEACPTSIGRLHFQHHLDAALYNEYGPTEATVWSSVYRVTGAETGGNLPIGEAIPGSCIKILDEHRRPVAEGETGEIYVSGPGVALGYHNQTSLTQLSFFPDPNGAGRMYRTGDLGRVGDSGQIEFAGRSDDQIKVRGYRVEPSEIEARLLEIPGVEKAVVVGNQGVLASFVVVARDDGASPNDLQRRLRDSLPEYMVPSTVTVLSELPYLANGKVDRQALLQLPEVPEPVDRTYLDPRDQLEFNLRALFQEVLGLRPVGIEDNFFDLGGHSLKAVELVNKIEGFFGTFVPLPSLFESPTVRGVADYIRSSGAGASSSSVVAIKRSGSRRPLFCVPGVGGHPLRHLVLPKHLDADQPYYVFQAPGFNDGECLSTIDALARRYIADMQDIQPNGPYLLAGECFGGIVAFEMARELHRRGMDMDMLALIECFMPPRAAGRIQNILNTINVRYPFLLRRFVPRSPVPDADTEPAAGRQRVIAGREDVLGYGVEGERALEYAPPHVKVRYANRGAGNAYKPGLYPGKVTMFLAPAKTPVFMDRRLIWRRYTPLEVDIYDITGDAYTMLREPHVVVLADKLNQALDRIHGS